MRKWYQTYLDMNESKKVRICKKKEQEQVLISNMISDFSYSSFYRALAYSEVGVVK
ncbi:hypothetical protein CI610_03476 [invertebrate metagenome]|uniref:Uncharacterized protein n=1 Tax=invertebrate metagenome TaxID=1711999 RepID=A0A2H9T336_9ZZZZ